MSNPHANHQGEPGATGTGDEIEHLAEIMWRAASRSGESIVVSQQALHVMARAVIASAPSPEAGAGGDLGELERLAKPLVDGFKACEELCSLADGDIPDNAEIYVRGAKRSSFGLFTYGDLRTLAAKIASAPSPDPAGAGGDLDWLLKQIADFCEDTEIKMDEALKKGPTNEQEFGFYRGQAYEAKSIRWAIAEVVRLRKEARSGKLVASTGSGEETKGADPYLTETTEALVARLEAELGVKGINSVFRRALAIAKEASADATPPKGLVGVVSGDVILEIDALTPQQSTSPTTETDPWATLRKIAELRHAEDACEPFDEALDLADAALRTLQAAGEVR